MGQRAFRVLAISLPPATVIASVIIRGGVRLAYDSATYATAARGLLSMHGLAAANGSHLTMFPPGYPIALASLIGVMPAEMAALVMDLMSATLIGWSMNQLLRGTPTPAALSTILLVSTNPAMWSVGSYMGSEMLGIALLMGALVTQDRSLQTEHDPRMVALTGTLAGLAGLTRTALAFAVVALFLGYLMRRRWVAAITSSLIAGGVPGSWALYNFIQYGSAAGNRLPPAQGAREVFSQILRTGSGWFNPLDVGGNHLLMLWGLVVAAAVMVIPIWPHTDSRVRLAMLYALGLGAGTVAAKLLTAMDVLGDRLLAPVVPFVGIAVAVGLRSVSTRWMRLALSGVVVLGSALGSCHAVLDNRSPASLPDIPCSMIPSDGVLWSDAPSVVAWECDRVVKDSPRAVYYATNVPATQDLIDARADVQAGCVVIAWVGGDTAGYRYQPEQLESMLGFRLAHPVGISILRSSRCTQ